MLENRKPSLYELEVFIFHFKSLLDFNNFSFIYDEIKSFDIQELKTFKEYLLKGNDEKALRDYYNYHYNFNNMFEKIRFMQLLKWHLIKFDAVIKKVSDYKLKQKEELELKTKKVNQIKQSFLLAKNIMVGNGVVYGRSK